MAGIMSATPACLNLSLTVTLLLLCGQEGRKISPSITCFEEVVMMGLPLYVDFGQLYVSVEDRKAKVRMLVCTRCALLTFCCPWTACCVE